MVFILTLLTVNVNVLPSGYNVYYLLSHQFLVQRDRFITSCFVCSPSQCSLFFLFFFSTAFYLQTRNKIKISVSRRERNHNSRFCFMSRSTSFLFKCILFLIAHSLLSASTAIVQLGVYVECFGVTVFSLWLVVFLAHSPRSVAGV